MKYENMNVYSNKMTDIMENPPKRIHLITHTDLDGYGCESIISNILPSITGERTNPGKPLIDSLEKAIAMFDNEGLELLIVTDLNLTPEAYDIVRSSKYLDKVFWIDHHRTNIESFDSTWVEENTCILSEYMGEPICATSLVWGLCRNSVNNTNICNDVGDIATEMIRMYDTYEFTRDANSPSISFAGNDKAYHPAYILNTAYHLGNAGRRFVDELYVSQYDAGDMTSLILNALYHINGGVYNDVINSILFRDADYVNKKLEKSFEYTAVINDREYKFRVIFAEKLINDVAHELMVIYPEVDFVAVIGDNAISLRCEKDGIDLSQIAKAFNPLGGGHKKAAGAGITPELRGYMVNATISKALELAK